MNNKSAFHVNLQNNESYIEYRFNMHRRTQSETHSSTLSTPNPRLMIRASINSNEIEKLLRKSDRQNKVKITFIDALNVSDNRLYQDPLFVFGRPSGIMKQKGRYYDQNHLDTILQKRAVSQKHRKSQTKQNIKINNKSECDCRKFKMVMPDLLVKQQRNKKKYESMKQSPRRGQRKSDNLLEKNKLDNDQLNKVKQKKKKRNVKPNKTKQGKKMRII